MKQAVLFFLIFSFGLQAQVDNFTTKRDSVSSLILNDIREFSVHLPPSYYSSNQNYPVLYILDGDYNFQYVSGILELQSSISENIPEMILIAISGKGTETYLKNCKPTIPGLKDAGNAHAVSNFIEKELIPYVDTNYKTADYKILAGHSIGGLFIINTALNKPQLFDNYVAISPALWWEDNAINAVADNILTNNPNYKTVVYMSLANEKGMGVDRFLGVVTASILKNNFFIFGITILAIIIAFLWVLVTRRKRLPLLLVIFGIGISVYLFFFYTPSNSNFKFKQFSNENHNSVGAPTYNWALNSIFKTWKVNQEYFKSEQKLVAHHDVVQKRYGMTFNMQKGILSNTVYMLHENPEELEKIRAKLQTLYPNAIGDFNVLWAKKLLTNDAKMEAIKLLEETITDFPNNYDAYNSLAKIALETNNIVKADSLIHKALNISEKQHIPQWQINELLETKGKIIKYKQK